MLSTLPKRVLLIAEAANPDWVSVPLVGWSLADALLRCVDGHLVTQVRNQSAIERTSLSQDAFTAIDSERIAKLMWRVGSSIKGGWGKGWTTLTALSAPSYYYFEYLLWKQFGDAIRRHEFDLVHRITPLSPTTPSLLAGKCRAAGVPFVLGPLNGGVPWPKAFDAAQPRKGMVVLCPRRVQTAPRLSRDTKECCGNRHRIDRYLGTDAQTVPFQVRLHSRKCRRPGTLPSAADEDGNASSSGRVSRSAGALQRGRHVVGSRSAPHSFR